MKPSLNISRGFTLLEMLLAVVVIGLTGTAISTAIGGVASQTHTLERRTMAHWVGQNHIHRLRMARTNAGAVPEGKDSSRLFMGSREWEVRTEITKTELPLIRRVDVEVYEVFDGEREGPYDTQVAFLGSSQ